MSLTADQEAKVSRFIVQVTAVGGRCETVADLPAVREYVVKLALGRNAKRIVVCDDLLSSELFPTNTAQGFEVASPVNSSREEFFKALETAEIGISSADLAVAETGTLIVSTSKESNRLVTALPEVHVAIVPRSKLVPSLQEAEPHVSEILKRTEGGVTISLISASSRTSDIGDKVILGVHGPKELHVLLLDQELPGGA